MDNNQTSFIPKREFYTKQEKKSTALRYSAFSVISFILLVGSILLSTGVFIYKQVLIKKISIINAELVAKKNSFQPELIDDMIKTDNGIEALKNLVDDKISVLLVFSLLEKETLENVRFTSFKYSKEAEAVTLELAGEALSPATVALQSDVFNSDPKISKPIFSGLFIAENGTAKFNFHGDLLNKHFLFSDLVNPPKVDNGTDSLNTDKNLDTVNDIGNLPNNN